MPSHRMPWFNDDAATQRGIPERDPDYIKIKQGLINIPNIVVRR